MQSIARCVKNFSNLSAYPTVPHAIHRRLMLWFFVALQTMAPFIHAHAGAVQLSHGRFLHVHQGVHSDAAWHVTAADQHGTEVAVAQGMRLRNDTPVAAPTLAMSAASPAIVVAGPRPGAGLPAPPPLHLVPPDHAHPYALAPPAA